MLSDGWNMTNPDTLFGRFGNRMFQMAYIFAKAPDIYCQDYRLFESKADEIRKWFGEGIGYLSQVGLHVRRGDYVDNPFYVDLMKTDYYQKAIDLFPEDKFLVFSDDPEWCEKQDIFKDDKRFQIMKGQTELEDFNMLASCKSQIIANSSFSWWAAYLCPNYGHKVIAPKAWYSDFIERTTIPPEWKRI